MARRKTVADIQREQEEFWKIGGYVRLSREDGEDESLSVINQKRIITDYIAEKFDGPHVVVDFYIDDGLTGTDYDRPDFQRLMRDVESKSVNCVVCKTLSRAFRNYSDQGYFLENFFPKHQTRFISIGGPHVDSYCNPEAITGLEVPITGLMNDRFAGKTSEDIRRTFYMKRKNGDFIGAFAPYGYVKDPDNKSRFLIDDEAAQVVRDIFNWFVHDGMSKHGIKRRLNEMGILNPAAYKRSKGLKYNNPQINMNDGLWDSTTVTRTLKNKMYLGHMVQGKQKIISYKVHDRVSMPENQWFIKENTHEAIITQELFDQAQDLSLRDTRTPNGEKSVWLFSGFVRCADCGKAMHRKSNKKGHSYYFCRTYEKARDRCTKHSINEQALSDAVLTAIRCQIIVVESLAQKLDAMNSAPVVQTRTKRIDALLNNRKQEYDKLRSAASALYLDWKGGDISKDDYRYMKEKFDGQLEQLTKIVATLEEEKRQLNDGLTTKENPLFTYFLKHRNIQNLDRSVMSSLLDVVLVHEGKDITVVFKYTDQCERLLALVEEGAEESATTN